MIVNEQTPRPKGFGLAIATFGVGLALGAILVAAVVVAG